MRVGESARGLVTVMAMGLVMAMGAVMTIVVVGWSGEDG